MTPQKTSFRAAPLVALLVLLLAIGIVATIFMQSRPEPQVILATPTIVPTVAPQADVGYHLSRGDLQAALYHVQYQATERGWTAGLHRQAGNIWREMGDTERALPHWESAAKLEASPDLLRLLATVYIERANWGIAFDHIEDLLQVSPQDGWAQYYAGLLLAPSDPARAQRYLVSVLQTYRVYAGDATRILDSIGNDYSDPLISSRVGAELASMGELSLAQNAFEYAAAANYPFPTAMAYAGLMQAQRGEDGRSWITQAVNLAPIDPTVRTIEGIYWRTVGDYDRSADALLLAMTYSPADPGLMAELGNTYRAMGNLTEAEYWLQVSLAISGNDPIIVGALDRLYQEEAYLLPQEYLALMFEERNNRDDPTVLSATAWAQHILGDSETALNTLNRALEQDPNNIRANFDKARILVDIGQPDEAREILSWISQSQTSFAPPAARLLESIE